MIPIAVGPPPRTKWPLALLFGISGGLVVGIVLLVFLWPTTSATPRNLPVSVVGSESAIAALEDSINEMSPGLMTFVGAADRDAALAQIESRDTSGAIILGDAPEVLTAPASSVASTYILYAVAVQLEDKLDGDAAAAGDNSLVTSVAVTSVVPLSESDPYGAGLAALTFPRLLAGVIGGLVVALFVAGVARRFAALAAFAITGGLVLGWVTQAGMGILQGNFLLNATALGLGLLATSSLIVGCTAVVGRAGAVFSAVLSIFIATPLSAASVPWQFHAEPWGLIGQYMVPGAANALLRSLSYFPDADITMQWLVLCGWALLGLSLAVVGHVRGTAVVRVPLITLEKPALDRVAI